MRRLKYVKAYNHKEIRNKEEQEINEACTEIKQKYFSNAMQKKGPNMQFQKWFDYADLDKMIGELEPERRTTF